MTTLKSIIARDETVSKDDDRPREETPKVSMKDFAKALTKVLPSVSKRDEYLYKSLEGSLRKSRSTITSGSRRPESGEDHGIGASKKPTPMKH